MKTKLQAITIYLVLLLGLPALSQETTLWSKETDWGTVAVKQEGTLRKLIFSSESGETEETRLDVENPALPLLPYVRQMVAMVALWESNREAPENPRLLVVGLGGASLSNALARRFPRSEIVSVEIEPVVVEAARKFFFYQESELVQTVLDDARSYLEQNERPFDLIFLDAFDGIGVPPSLRTLEFAQLLDRNLREGGGVVANIHFTPREPSLRYRKSLEIVFPHSYLTVGVAQGVGLYTHFPVSVAPLEHSLEQWNQKYDLPLEKVITGRHQEDLEAVKPFRD
ncbi:MAG: fused MFS/spermidine synthase [Vulcanimicrobiota bacterium]